MVVSLAQYHSVPNGMHFYREKGQNYNDGKK
jgi:hypothetical protein